MNDKYYFKLKFISKVVELALRKKEILRRRFKYLVGGRLIAKLEAISRAAHNQ